MELRDIKLQGAFLWYMVKTTLDKLACITCIYKAVAFMVISYASEIVFRSASPYLPSAILSNQYAVKFIMTYLTFMGIELGRDFGLNTIFPQFF